MHKFALIAFVSKKDERAESDNFGNMVRSALQGIPEKKPLQQINTGTYQIELSVPGLIILGALLSQAKNYEFEAKVLFLEQGQTFVDEVS